MINNELINIPSPLGSLEEYISYAQRLPMLSSQEEKLLINEFCDNNNIEAARKLILCHLKFVIKIARGYIGYGLALGDLIQEGNIGLMKAVKKFNKSYNNKLSSFASYWIKSEIHEFIIKNWRIVKVATTKSQRKLFFKLRSFNTGNNKSKIETIAKTLNVKSCDVKVMHERLYSDDISFSAKPDKYENNSYIPEDNLHDWEHNPEKAILSKEDKRTIYDSINMLPERDKYIITQRWLSDKKSTLQDIAKNLNISLERVRQVEKQALNKLKHYVISTT